MSVGVRRSKSLLCPKDAPSKLTIHQQQALLTSWKSLRPIVQIIMRKILYNLEEEIPKVKQIFCKTAVLDALSRESTSEKPATLDEHIKLMIEYAFLIIYFRYSPCRYLGKLSEITMQSFSTQDAVQVSKTEYQNDRPISETKNQISKVKYRIQEAGKAWRILIAWVTDELRCGFDGRARVNSRNSSLTVLEKSSEQQQYSPDINELQQQLQQLRFDYE
ncbi:BMA-GLB-9 [Dirofilaria immitis]|nr:BMA-GLB-9 [Dirofilaria immitis]